MGFTSSILAVDSASGGEVATDLIEDAVGKPPAPAPAPPPPIPIAADSTEAQAAQAAARERQRRAARAAGGRSSTILTSPLGLTSPPNNAISRTILGG